MKLDLTGNLAPAFGMAAVCMTAAVFMVGVYVPTKLAPQVGDGFGVASSGRTPVAIIPSRIEVIGVVTEAAAVKS